ncbi:MAG: M20/M25/M40 family metallo-hydrolase [Armatimonadetes bacterium]|nr:M20/M25/M40 family metallo-hydrolase [Armatimonadota bacterium]
MTVALLAALVLPSPLPNEPQNVADRLLARGLTDLGAYEMLYELCTTIGGRLSGSPEAARAVIWTALQMDEIGLSNIRQIRCMVPHWVRGATERAAIIVSDDRVHGLSICALGGSVGTPVGGIEAEVVEVKSLEEAENLGERGKGKIVFFNRGFDPTLPTTFAAYGGTVDQRSGGASAAAKSGAVAVLVRSMTLAKDDEPHTGAMRYSEGRRIPAAALGIQSADRLSAALKRGPVTVRLELSCRSLPDEPSANVLGEIVGSEMPNEVIVMGGHLDSWDLGQGAHDDGAGVTQALEALRLLKELGLRPKRTIRVVAFMNEENGLRGATAYAEMAANADEVHYAAIESDAGGFMPRAFSVTESKLERVQEWAPLFQVFGIERFTPGGGGADINPLGPLGTTLFGLRPDNQRYFDYHHSRNDTIDKVNARELEMGAMAMALLAWLISEEGLEDQTSTP